MIATSLQQSGSDQHLEMTLKLGKRFEIWIWVLGFKQVCKCSFSCPTGSGSDQAAEGDHAD